MKSKTIREDISKFIGNIQAVYTFTKDNKDNFPFELDINFESPNSLQRFTNVIRNMISRGLMDKPSKLGKNLMFNERTYLQLIIVRKYMAAGCSIDSLVGYVTNLTIEDLYVRLFTKQIIDIDKLMQKSQEVAVKSIKINNPNLCHYIKIDTGLFLLAQQESYTSDEIDIMVDLLKKHLGSL